MTANPGTRNVIVLTHGWTGSSVFSALLGQAGYWLGGETVHKPDYNTYESADLVALNRRLLRELHPTLAHEHRFDVADVLAIERAAEQLDLAPYRDFVRSCDAQAPWLWKDPRLTWTIRVWARALDLERIAVLVLTRDPVQAWVSSNIRRHIQSPQFTRRYNDGITQSNLHFVRSSGLPCLQASFEDLLLRPEATLDRLNAAFGLALTMDTLRAVCSEPLYRKSRGPIDHAHALLIYLKNHARRDGRSAGATARRKADAAA
ncbi:MAG: sulfotransferase [Proteobacteria bacterium]|nr:sulfotransferase [Pseudomonadota bacterium]